MSVLFYDFLLSNFLLLHKKIIGDLNIAEPTTADTDFLRNAIPPGIGGILLIIIVAIVLCGILVYRRRRSRPLPNTRYSYTIKKEMTTMNVKNCSFGIIIL